MPMEIIMEYLTQYGALAIFLIVLMEYMNLPGFPAGVIMPLAGIWAAHGKLKFLTAILITTAAGLIGSWILYLLGFAGGALLLDKYMEKFPKQKESLNKYYQILKERGGVCIFICKLIPMVRTLISIPAGVMKMNFISYTASSALGIAVWNLVFVGAGYFLGDAVFRYLM